MEELLPVERDVVRMNALYTFGTSMSNVFVSVFIFNYTNSLELTALYACCRYITIPIFAWLGGYLNKKMKINRIITAGLILIILAYVMLLTIRESIPTMVWLAYVVGVIIGSGEGLYWFIMNVLNQNVARVHIRNLFLSSLGVWNGLANIVAPLVSSLIINMAPSDIQGYIVIFIAVIFIYGIVAFQGSQLEIDYLTRDFSVIKLMRSKNKRWVYQKWIMFFNCLREAYTIILSSILIYQLFDNSGALLSYFNAAMSILSIVCYQIVARYIPHNKMKYAYQLGNLMLIVAMVFLTFSTHILGAMAFGILNTVGSPLYSNPFNMIKMKSITEESENFNVTANVICLEIYVSLGRIAGLGAIVILANLFPDPNYIYYSTFVMIFGAIVVSLMTHYYGKKEVLL